jgi:hypothetical protein
VNERSGLSYSPNESERIPAELQRPSLEPEHLLDAALKLEPSNIAALSAMASFRLNVLGDRSGAAQLLEEAILVAPNAACLEDLAEVSLLS